jgi:hypothetical protein
MPVSDARFLTISVILFMLILDKLGLKSTNVGKPTYFNDPSESQFVERMMKKRVLHEC